MQVEYLQSIIVSFVIKIDIFGIWKISYILFSYPDGTQQIILETTEAGFATQDAMRALIEWYKRDITTHPLVKCALFAYEFVSIHHFQNGNGRLSRLLSTLLLLKNG